MVEIPNCFYRVSVKALITDKKGRFLLQKEERGVWDLPGGGLNFGENPVEGLKREIKEEMGLELKNINTQPCYFVTAQYDETPWFSNVVYEAQVCDIEKFKPSNECIEYKYFTNKEVLEDNNVLKNVKEFAKMYRINN